MTTAGRTSPGWGSAPERHGVSLGQEGLNRFRKTPQARIESAAFGGDAETGGNLLIGSTAM